MTEDGSIIRSLRDELYWLRRDLGSWDSSGLRLAISIDDTRVTFVAIGRPCDDDDLLIGGMPMEMLPLVTRGQSLLDRAGMLLHESLPYLADQSRRDLFTGTSQDIYAWATFLCTGIRNIHRSALDTHRSWIDNPGGVSIEAIDHLLTDLPIHGGRATSGDKEKNNGIEALRPAARKAYLTYQVAELKAGSRLEDREAYDLLKEKGLSDNTNGLGELDEYPLPTFDTWVRHLREARQSLGEQKSSPRAGRASGSVVSRDQI